MIFYGDSITQGWVGAGLDFWKKYYGQIHAVNNGIGGDVIQNVIWRIRNGEIEELDPKLIVLKIGTNNINYDKDEDIAKGIKQIIDDFHAKLPNTKILLLGILPRGDHMEFQPRIKHINHIEISDL